MSGYAAGVVWATVIYSADTKKIDSPSEDAILSAGEIPTELGGLKFLGLLDLSGNNLTGTHVNQRPPSVLLCPCSPWRSGAWIVDQPAVMMLSGRSCVDLLTCPRHLKQMS